MQTGQSRVGTLVFSVGFVMIVLLGLELVTGSFALLPMAWVAGQTTPSAIAGNWYWVFIGNLVGSVVYGGLLALTMVGQIEPAGVAERIRRIAELKTTGYAHFGAAGTFTVSVKAILCNWMVCFCVVTGNVLHIHDRTPPAHPGRHPERAS